MAEKSRSNCSSELHKSTVLQAEFSEYAINTAKYW